MCDYSKFSDEELIAKAKEGELDVSDYLLDKYKDIVRKKARAMYLIGGDTDDLIQEGMLGLFKAIRDYKPGKEASFQTFARLCIDRQMYHAIEGSNRQKHQPLNSYVSLSQENHEEVHLGELWASSPETILIDRENARSMEQEIRDCLSPFENHVLDFYIRGYDYQQIAEEFDKKPKSIDNALQRVRQKVRECVLGNNAQ